ncbi:MAG: nucleoside transporter C-terminal domain-containing protein [Bacteroidales bacterium]
MNRRLLTKLAGIIIISFMVASCSSSDEVGESVEINKKWALDTIHDTNAEKQDSIDFNKGFLTLIEGEEKQYKAFFPEHEKETAGIWSLKNDTLMLFPLPVDAREEVDSVAYVAEDGIPMLLYFKDKIELARIVDDGLIVPDRPVVFIVEDLSNDYLRLRKEGVVYEYKETVTELPFVESFGVTSVLRGLLGLFILVALAYVFSANRKAVNWMVVVKGLAIQIILAILILKVPFVQHMFEFVSKLFLMVLNFSQEGAEFLLGGLMDVESYGFIFAFQVLPTIIFFSALTSVLFYLGVIQKIVYALAWVMVKAMRLSGTESLSVAGNIFLGQTESPLLIKAYLPDMNKSEIMLVMIGGMATIAGGVLAAYIAFLGGDDPAQRLYFARHLLAASIMAAPGAIVVSKILMPQTEEINKQVTVSKDKIGSNILEAITNGTGEGLRLAVNVAAMLLVFVAMIAFLNYIFGYVGQLTSLNPVIADITGGQYDKLSLQFILGYLFAPLVYSIGVSSQDMALVGQLLGEKITMSEFIAYISLAELKTSFASEKSIVMATYMLCGFANFASIGIQIGGIGSLAPNQRTRLSQFGMRALIGGTIASLFSATIVGMLF